jgi:hypothetical protein
MMALGETMSASPVFKVTMSEKSPVITSRTSEGTDGVRLIHFKEWGAFLVGR